MINLDEHDFLYCLFSQAQNPIRILNQIGLNLHCVSPLLCSFEVLFNFNYESI